MASVSECGLSPLALSSECHRKLITAEADRFSSQRSTHNEPGSWNAELQVQLVLTLLSVQSANSIGAGCDMTALLPRWINIRRGSYICAIAGLAYCPWHLFASSNDFTTYLSAYSVLLSSVAGVMLCDYYFVRKGVSAFDI